MCITYEVLLLYITPETYILLLIFIKIDHLEYNRLKCYCELYTSKALQSKNLISIGENLCLTLYMPSYPI